MKRTLLLSFMSASMVFAYACSSSKEDPTPTPTPTNEGGPGNDGGGTDGNTVTDGGTDGNTPDGTVPTGNPIEGVGNPTAVAAFGASQYLEGPVWLGTSLYVSEYA